MSMLDTILRPFRPSAKKRQNGGLPYLGGGMDFTPANSRYFGPGIGSQPTHSALLRESLGYADMATRAISNRIASLEPQVKIARRVMSGTTVEEILDDHALKRLLDTPHPNFSRAQLLRLTAQYILTVGEAYWLKVGSLLGTPIELHPVPPTNIWPIVAGGVIQSYRVRDGDGRERDLEASNIVRFFFPDPENIWGSEGYLGPAGTTADALKFSGQHLRAHYEHDASPKAVLEAGETAQAFSDPERERFVAEWRKRYSARMGRDVGIPAILPTGYKLVELALMSGADVVPLLQHWRDEQLMGFGVPRSVLGQVVSGDRSSAETNQYVFDLHTVLPIATMMLDAMNQQLAPDFDESIYVAFEEFVSSDKAHDLAQENQDLTQKVRSINQVREDRGLDPVDWGELPVGQLGQVPYDAMEYEFEPDDASALDEEGRKRARKRADFFSPAAEWARQVKREKKYVPAFLRATRAILAQQRDSVLERLRERENRSRAPVPAELFTPEEWQSLFELRVEPIREAAFKEILGETLAGLGVDEFIFTDEMRKVIRDQGARLIKQVNETTGKRLARAISEAQATLIAEQLEAGTVAGEGIEEIAKRVRHVFAVRRKEARTIARTEMLKASQQAQVTGFETSEVVEKKKWNTSMDDAVRDEHIATEGQTVGVRESFTLGDGELADAPGIGAGGGTLSAHNSINCRCFLTPVLEG